MWETLITIWVCLFDLSKKKYGFIYLRSSFSFENFCSVLNDWKCDLQGPLFDQLYRSGFEVLVNFSLRFCLFLRKWEKKNEILNQRLKKRRKITLKVESSCFEDFLTKPCPAVQRSRRTRWLAHTHFYVIVVASAYTWRSK